ncbi:hypothetical protein [Sinorhizobium fredii]|uniref:hypothetical protein n=1 Tax=Rhizobium fredii TaxID=380 RepID=UPI0035169EC6
MGHVRGQVWRHSETLPTRTATARPSLSGPPQGADLRNASGRYIEDLRGFKDIAVEMGKHPFVLISTIASARVGAILISRPDLQMPHAAQKLATSFSGALVDCANETSLGVLQ